MTHSTPSCLEVYLVEYRSMLIVETTLEKYVFDLQHNTYITSINDKASLMTPLERMDALRHISEYLGSTPHPLDGKNIEQYVERIREVSDETLQQKISNYNQKQLRIYMFQQAQLLELNFPDKK